MSELFELVREFVRQSYTKEGITSSTFDHQVEVANLIKNLNEDANEALLIAAVSHDIERAYRKEDMFALLKSKESGFMDKEFLTLHQTRGAEIIKDFLITQKCPKDIIVRVEYLITHHEVGGDQEADLLKDADSLSFFNTRALHFVETKIGVSSTQKVKMKLEWMFERISSDVIKKIAQPNYEIALKELDKK